MKNLFNNIGNEIGLRFKHIETLVENKSFKDALAEIRDLEVSQKFELGSFELGYFCYISTKVFRMLGDYKTALDKGKCAFEIFRNTSENQLVGKIQYELGCAYLSLGDFENATDELRDALATFKRIDDNNGIISVLNMLAGVYFKESDYKSSIRYLSEGIKLCDKIGEIKTRCSLSRNIGRIYLLIGNLHLAKQYLSENIQTLKQGKDELNLSQALLSLGFVYSHQRNFKKAQELYDESLELVIKNNYTRELTIYHEYSGALATEEGDYKKAEEHFTKVLEIMERIAPEGDMVSQTYRLLADLQVTKKEYDKALASCQKSLEVCLSLGEKIEEAACYRVFGQVYTVKKDYKKAKENFEKSINLFQKIDAKYELGKIYIEAGKSNSFDYFERVKYLSQAEDIFREIEIRYYIGQINFAYSYLFFENNETEKAQIYLSTAEKLFKELNEEKELNSVLEFKKKLQRFSSENLFNSDRRYSFSEIVTHNPKMLEIIEISRQVKDSNIPILIEGETGTGKDLLAKAIHYESKRKDQRFVIVNCAAIPETLLESELFGYKKGAFTGAVSDKKGLLEEADGGTLFLNEICELPWLIQAKLLGVIENKELTRLGDTKPRKVDFRIIAASNLNLEEEVKFSRFRKDLYYRLNIMRFELPPLRERKEDIPFLVDFFAKSFSNDKTQIPLENFENFTGYDWPGNVRELQNEIMKLIVETNGNKLNSSLLSSRFHKNCDQGGASPDKKDVSFHGRIEEYEKELILKALEDTNWVKREAARTLNMPYSTFRFKLKQFGIE